MNRLIAGGATFNIEGTSVGGLRAIDAPQLYCPTQTQTQFSSNFSYLICRKKKKDQL